MDATTVTYPDLERWLDIATRGLRDASRERIGDEMTEHFEAARADAMQNGMGELAAERYALETLGNAREARRHFRREHFTAAEALAYLGEDSEAHRKACARASARWIGALGATGSLATQFMFFESTDVWPGIWRVIGAEVAVLILGALIICIPQLNSWYVSHVSHLVKGRDSQATLRKNRIAAKVWLVIGFAGVVTATIATGIIFGSGHAFAPMPGILGDAGAVAMGANLFLLLTAISAFVSLRQCARITRLLDKESKPNVHG